MKKETYSLFNQMMEDYVHSESIVRRLKEILDEEQSPEQFPPYPPKLKILFKQLKNVMLQNASLFKANALHTFNELTEDEIEIWYGNDDCGKYYHLSVNYRKIEIDIHIHHISIDCSDVDKLDHLDECVQQSIDAFKSVCKKIGG